MFTFPFERAEGGLKELKLLNKKYKLKNGIISCACDFLLFGFHVV